MILGRGDLEAIDAIALDDPAEQRTGDFKVFRGGRFLAGPENFLALP